MTPTTGWLNDPNGLIRLGNRYHVFHQLHEGAPSWGAPSWGHVSSDDLVRWERHATALVPTPGPDGGGCWSGCAVEDGRLPTAIYTGVEPDGDGWRQTVCVGRGDRSLERWERDPASPVIPTPPDGTQALGFRDPFAWREGDGWAMVVGSGTAARGGSAQLYRSDDLLTWRYVGPLLEAADLARMASHVAGLGSLGRIWECPQLVPLGDRHLLLYSLWDDLRPDPRGYGMRELHHAIAVIGRYDGRRFQPEQVERFDHGPDHYAPALLADLDGRILAWGWSWEALSDEARIAQGWAGALTLPRVIELVDGRLAVRLAPELERLHGRSQVVDGRLLTPSDPELELPGGAHLDVAIRFEALTAGAVGVTLRRTPDGAERTELRYDIVRRQLEVDRTRASQAPGAHGGTFAAPLDLGHDGSLELHVIIDGSMMEIVAQQRVVMTVRIYPTRDDAVGVRAFAERGHARVASASVTDLPRPSGVMEP